jgi:serine/threonine protein kinase
MTGRAQIRQIEAVNAEFAAFHHGALPAAGDTVILGPSMASGGFGVLHPIERMGGVAPPVALIAKLFDHDVLNHNGGTRPIISHAEQLHRALAARPVHVWAQALLALPYCLAMVELAGRPELMALMLDMRPMGYVTSPFDDRTRIADHMSLDITDRIELALRFAEKAELLASIGFLHGDLNAQNIMVRDDATDVQIIDFDCGVIVKDGSERPLTPGKPDDCMPPEIKRNQRDQIDMSLLTLAAERWSLGSMLGYLLFGFHPAFFLREISRKTIKEYMAGPADWPDIDVSGPLFTTQSHNRPIYDRMRAELSSLPEGTRDLFVQLFRAGLDAERRPSASEWVAGLAGMRKPPVVEEFTIDEDYVLEGTEITLSWRASNATHVEVPDAGSQPATGTVHLVPTRTTAYRVRAVNAFGDFESPTEVVRVVPLPRMQWLPVPAFPRFEISTVVDLGVAEDMPNPVSAPPALSGFFARMEPSTDAHPLSVPPAPRLRDLWRDVPRFTSR